MARKDKPRYDGHCRDTEVSPDQPHVIRFRNPLQGEVVIDDQIRGRVVVANAELDDLVIRRSDGSPTYNLTVVVDDSDPNNVKVAAGFMGSDFEVFADPLGFVTITDTGDGDFWVVDGTGPDFESLTIVLGVGNDTLSMGVASTFNFDLNVNSLISFLATEDSSSPINVTARKNDSPSGPPMVCRARINSTPHSNNASMMILVIYIRPSHLSEIGFLIYFKVFR